MGQCSPCKLVSSDDPSNARFLALRPSSIHNLGTNYDTDLATSYRHKEPEHRDEEFVGKLSMRV